MSERRLRLGILASGAGTTLQAVIDASESGALSAAVAVVISNNSRSGALARAERHGIDCVHLSTRTHADPAALDAAIAAALARHDVDVVLLAGYMKKLGPRTLGRFAGRVINTHPSLLPRYGGRGMYGGHVHAAVLAGGDAATGVSVHLVDGEYDTGRVLASREVPVAPDDDVVSLARRVQRAERPFLIEVLERIATGDIRLPPA